MKKRKSIIALDWTEKVLMHDKTQDMELSDTFLSNSNQNTNEVDRCSEKGANEQSDSEMKLVFSESEKSSDPLNNDESEKLDESDDNSDEAKPNLNKTVKKRKKGLVYVANLPKHMNVTLIREYLGQYGDIGRVYLQPDKTAMCRSKKRKNMARHFSEGWVEFLSKRVAKEVAAKLNNTQIGTRKRSKFYDSLWCIKFLPSFKWVHLSERLAYEQAVYKKRLMAEISQARKEADFFQQNLDKSEIVKKLDKKKKKKIKIDM